MNFQTVCYLKPARAVVLVPRMIAYRVSRQPAAWLKHNQPELASTSLSAFVG